MRIVSDVNLKLILLYLMHICVALLTAAALNSCDTDVAGITQKTNLEIMQFRAHPRGKHRCVHLCVYAGECERASLLYGILERLRASLYECVSVCVRTRRTWKEQKADRVPDCQSLFFCIFPTHEIFTPITMRPHQLFTANLRTPQRTVTCDVKCISIGILNHLVQTINNAVIYILH